jgi:protein-disulfide isomerase
MPSASPTVEIKNNDSSPLPSPTPQNNNINLNSGDHILGSPDAPVSIVLYSDIECPFCKRFHATMEKIIDEYGKTGKVKWIYRHFPLPQLHPTAPKEAEATECATELGGNTKFWEYLNYLTYNNIDKTNINQSLVNVAGKIGLDETKFKQCLDSGKYTAKINQATKEAQSAGAQGTPFSVVLGPNGKQETIPGAYPYENVKEVIEKMLAN